MPTLSDAEQAELDRLLAEKAAPDPRTEDGVVGILHALIDSASGVVAHRGGDEWDVLHKKAEALAHPEPAPYTPPAYGTESAGFTG